MNERDTQGHNERGHRALKRIRLERGSLTFWIGKRGNTFIAYMTFINAILGVASPSIMSMYGAEGLKRLYEGKNGKGLFK